MNFKSKITSIFKDDLLRLIIGLAIGGLCLTVGLQYPDHSILILVAAFVWIVSFVHFIPRIRKKQLEDEKVEEK